ncbi:MAG TPA: DNA-primase RepB domain-containing protein [Chloroflexota bacterium]|nr:DNA-primase RepB domain-containing protein [Chloroflexota bacterium]
METVADGVRLWRHVHGERQDLLQVFTGYRKTREKKAKLDMVAERYYAPGQVEAAAAWVSQQDSINRDVYFCAHQLLANKRIKDNASAIVCLWADVDNVELAESPIKPTAVVESSPGHVHAYARLSRPIAPPKAEELNKRWARAFGADGSGFDLTQLLRVPGTHNYGYADTPEVRLLEIDDETVYDPDELDRILPKLPEPKISASQTPSAALSDDDQELIALLLERSPVFAALWQGKTSTYADEHGVVDDNRADWGLIRELLRATGHDADRTERLARLSDLATMRKEKWDSARGNENWLRYSIGRAKKQWDQDEMTSWGEPSRLLAASSSNGTASSNGHQVDPTTGEVLEDHANGVTPRATGEPSWPSPLAAEAFHGWAGALVRAIEPYSEADLAALLAHVLCGAGALIGPNVYAKAGDALHPARLNAAVVGETSKGRKGSAARPTERVLRLADAEFGPRITEGLSSGEGLIWQVRDPVEKYERQGRGEDRKVELVEVDPGIKDKRLLVIESEFASTLRVLQREGNTLSTVVRRAWDSGDLKTLTKNSPAVATGAHICVVGHVTKDELLRYLDRSEMGNGFANRFLWIAAKRGQVLPDGEGTPNEVLQPFVDELWQTARWAKTVRVMARDAEAGEVWRAVYPKLSAGAPGMFGGATNRAEAQVLRLSVLYAVLDRSESIGADHLLASLAVWKYAEESARWIFGDAVGDPTADAILSALRQNGEMTRNDLVDLFGRHVNRNRIDLALSLLLRLGLVRMRKEDTGGRPREVWLAK